MPDLRSRLKTIPEGAAALFFIQIFATLGFAVLYSTLVLYATRHLHFSAKEASAIMGVFGAFNYGLHLFGGYLGGRFLSNRNLFVGGMLLQVLGCGTMSFGTVDTMYLGLALFLTGSGLNVTCINMMLTQRFAPADLRRESAFFWNYAGMNMGFFIGFAVAGHYQLTENYSRLFLFATVGNFLAIVLALFNWKTLADRSTRLLDVTPRQFKARFVAGIAILIGLVPIVWFMLQRTGPTGTIFKTFSVVLAGLLVYLTVKHKDRRERNNMWAYLILALGSLVFWSLYQMAPNGLQLFAVNNVRLRVWGVEVAPQWIQNINTVSIVIGGPLLAALFAKWRARGWNIDIPQQFAVALILMGLGFLALPVGISFADTAGKTAFVWLFVSYRPAERGRAADLAGRLRDDRQAGAARVPGNHDGQLDARDRPGLPLRRRLLRDDPRTVGHHGAHQQPRIHQPVLEARLGQHRGRHPARAADSVPAPPDQGQGSGGRRCAGGGGTGALAHSRLSSA